MPVVLLILVTVGLRLHGPQRSDLAAKTTRLFGVIYFTRILIAIMNVVSSTRQSVLPVLLKSKDAGRLGSLTGCCSSNGSCNCLAQPIETRPLGYLSHPPPPPIRIPSFAFQIFSSREHRQNRIVQRTRRMGTHKQANKILCTLHTENIDQRLPHLPSKTTVIRCYHHHYSQMETLEWDVKAEQLWQEQNENGI